MKDLDLQVDEWREAHGGLRGSTLLRAGALLAVLSLLVETGSRILVPDLESGPWGVTAGAWLGWIASLAVLGLGFVWTGMNPVLSRYGLLVGAFHLLHAAFLLARIFTALDLAVPPRTLVVGRVVLVFMFALQERDDLGSRASGLLLGASALALVKTLAAVWGFPSGLGRVGDALWDLLPSLLLAFALFHAAGLIRRQEDDWAEAFLADRGAGFGDLTNPLNPRHTEDR